MNNAVAGAVVWTFEAEMGKLEQSLRDAQSKVSKAADNIQKKIDGSMKSLTSSIDKASKSIGSLGDSLIKLGAAPTAAVAASAFAFSRFEDNMANVRKTVGLTADETDALSKSILDMSKNTRTSINDLVEIATVGGQIGIASDDILAFTDAINVASVALGDEFTGGAEQVTKELGTLRQLFKDVKTDKVDQDLLRIGNAINELGASGLATGPVVTDFATRIVGLTGGLGNSAGDILGMSAALQELGVNAERGGSNVGRIFQIIAKDSAGIAKALKIDVGEFTTLVNKDINEAFLLVAKRTKELGAENTEFAKILDAIGLDAVGASEVLQKAGENIDLIREKQDLANTALTNNNSLMDEYNIKNETALARSEKFRNSIEGVAIVVGQKLVPEINNTLDRLTPLIDGFAKFVEDHPKVVSSALLLGSAIGGIGAALKVVSFALGGFSGVLSGSKTAFILLGKAISTSLGLGTVKTVGDSIAAIRIGLTTLSTTTIPVVMTAFKTLGAFLLTNPIGIALTVAIVAIGGFALAWNNNWFDIQGKTKTAIDGIAGFFSSIPETLSKAKDSFFNFITDVGNSFVTFNTDLPGNLAEALGKAFGHIVNWGKSTLKYLQENIPKWIDTVTETLSALPGKIWETLTTSYNDFYTWTNDISNFLKENIPKWIDTVVSFFSQLPTKISEWLKSTDSKVNEEFLRIVETIKTILTELPGKVLEWGKNVGQAFVDGIGNGLKGLKDKFTQGFNDARGVAEGHSPPKEGPFKNIDKWGFNVGQAWVDGFEGAMQSISMPQPSSSYQSGSINSGQGQVVGGSRDITVTIEKVDSKESVNSLVRELGFLTGTQPGFAL